MTYSKVIDGLVTNLSFSITRASSKGLVEQVTCIIV
jgi:hypothetical protein